MDPPGFRPHQLRSVADADALREALENASAVALIGAGFIGLEFAAVAAERGIPITVIEATGRPMARALSPEMSGLFRGFHERAGVRFAFDACVTGLAGRNARVAGVETAAGGFIPAELVLIGIGVVPNAELAAAAGVNVADGILVDEWLVTSDAAISAIGDCTRFPAVRSTRSIRRAGGRHGT
jgi:3-phenylpropionate/trans-cinnamate dioxygenase ferredoxin reductase subunit